MRPTRRGMPRASATSCNACCRAPSFSQRRSKHQKSPPRALATCGITWRPFLANLKRARSSGMSNVKAIPNGMHTVTPHLVCAGAADAIEFYKKAYWRHLITSMCISVRWNPTTSGSAITAGAGLAFGSDTQAQARRCRACPSLSEGHGGDGAADLVRRPEGDRSGRDARRGDVGALAGLVENLLAGGVRYAHRPFDQEYAEHLIVDRPAPEFRATDADDRNRRRHARIRARQFRHLA